jgi:hypothetical protein
MVEFLKRSDVSCPYKNENLAGVNVDDPMSPS